jgi:hypothetical protein
MSCKGAPAMAAFLSRVYHIWTTVLASLVVKSADQLRRGTVPAHVTGGGLHDGCLLDSSFRTLNLMGIPSPRPVAIQYTSLGELTKLPLPSYPHHSSPLLLTLLMLEQYRNIWGLFASVGFTHSQENSSRQLGTSTRVYGGTGGAAVGSVRLAARARSAMRCDVSLHHGGKCAADLMSGPRRRQVLFRSRATESAPPIP